MIPPLSRNKNVEFLIEEGLYFVIHAARQTGKTTLIQHIVDKINSENTFYALYCSLESVQVFTEPEKGIPEILSNIMFAVKHSDIPNKNELIFESEKINYSSVIKDYFSSICDLTDKPLILLIDEIDGLQNGTLITFLRQLRDGYISRKKIPFPHSIALVGMRNIRDCKSKIREEKTTLGSTGSFNIITETLTISNLTKEQIKELYNQHTELTGQKFSDEVVDIVYDKTDGQPWLVNAIARKVIIEILEMDFSKPINTDMAEEAIQNIIMRRDTHIDSLLDKLKEPRVKKVIEPIILGKTVELNITDDDTQFCLDLGLIKEENKRLLPANKIYNEVIIRALSYDTQFNLHAKVENIWIDEAGIIDMDGLLKGFQQFWRENSKIWSERYQYKEAAPHLILQAFLQRITNGGGHILREYASGRERLDLCVVFENKKYPIELKLKYSEKTKEQGIKQLSSYIDTLGEQKGWLIIFDRDEEKSWDEKVFWETEIVDNKTIHIVGC